jgi:small subunit ribosomal protein S1
MTIEENLRAARKSHKVRLYEDPAMSDTDKPEPPAAQPAEGPPPAPAQPERPPPFGKVRFRKEPEPGKLPEPAPGPLPELQPEEAYGPGPRLRDLDASIEDELAEAMGGFSDKDLYGEPQHGRPRAPAGAEPGKLKAKVVSVHGSDVFLDVPGGRTPGLLPLAQFPDGPPAPGTQVEVHIEGYDNANGLLILTRQGAAVQADWSSVAPGMIVEARVTETNKGGLAVDVNGIRGFMPISQIDMYRVENTEQFVNQRLRCMVTEVNPEERNLVVSRRALLEQEREASREKLWAELAEGQARDGIVRSVRDFGAFVDLGGADGLLHVSEMSWVRVKDPTEVVQPGQTVKVVVLKVDREARKISLGLKQLTASPWDTADTNYAVGSLVKGTVTRHMDFGALVELEPGIEGLIHISELSPQRVRRPADIVQIGQEVTVRVLSIDKNQRRMSLSLKGAQPKQGEEPVDAEEAEETPAEVKPERPRTTPLRGGLGSR